MKCNQVLLATDLHAGNVLRAEREPWLVIDPKGPPMDVRPGSGGGDGWSSVDLALALAILVAWLRMEKEANRLIRSFEPDNLHGSVGMSRQFLRAILVEN